MTQQTRPFILTPTVRDTSLLIEQIAPQPHTELDYNQALHYIRSLQKDKAEIIPPLLLSLIEATPKGFPQNPQSTLCACCFSQISSLRYWCGICGQVTCKPCLVRQRIIRDEDAVNYCNKCDRQYLQALNQLQFYNALIKIKTAFQTLVSEQESLEKLVQMEITKNGGREIQVENKKIQEYNKELEKKIAYGVDIKRQKKKVLNNLKKKISESFSSVGGIDMNIAPPTAENQLDISTQRINESMLEDMLENQNTKELQMDRKMCTCKIY